MLRSVLERQSPCMMAGAPAVDAVPLPDVSIVPVWGHSRAPPGWLPSPDVSSQADLFRDPLQYGLASGQPQVAGHQGLAHQQQQQPLLAQPTAYPVMAQHGGQIVGYPAQVGWTGPFRLSD